MGLTTEQCETTVDSMHMVEVWIASDVHRTGTVEPEDEDAKVVPMNTVLPFDSSDVGRGPLMPMISGADSAEMLQDLALEEVGDHQGLPINGVEH